MRHALQTKCDVRSSIPGTDRAERRAEQDCVELGAAFTEKMMLKEQKCEVISDRSHCSR